MAAVKSFLLALTLIVVHMTLFFISAGSFVGYRPWVFFGASFLHYGVGMVIQFKLNPELLVHRLKMRREGSKRWDEILMRVTNLTILLAVPITAGLDLGRLNWTTLDPGYMILGLIFLVVSTILLNWAMVVNPHFEPTVRIQRDRDHMVISRGPYRLVRHPGYLAGIFYALSIPMIFGSLVTFVPAGIYAILLIIRTSLEDRTLREELKGYSEYSDKVQFKLIPGIW